MKPRVKLRRADTPRRVDTQKSGTNGWLESRTAQSGNCQGKVRGIGRRPKESPEAQWPGGRKNGGP